MPLVAIAAPLACFAVDHYERAIFGDYQVGLEILALNGALTFAGLWLISMRARGSPAPIENPETNFGVTFATGSCFDTNNSRH